MRLFICIGATSCWRVSVTPAGMKRQDFLCARKRSQDVRQFPTMEVCVAYSVALTERLFSATRRSAVPSALAACVQVYHVSMGTRSRKFHSRLVCSAMSQGLRRTQTAQLLI